MIETLNFIDKTGVRRNITEILGHLDQRELKSIVTIYRLKEKDKPVYFFWNGDDYELLGMLAQAMQDIASRNESISEREYSDFLDDEEDV